MKKKPIIIITISLILIVLGILLGIIYDKEKHQSAVNDNRDTQEVINTETDIDTELEDDSLEEIDNTPIINKLAESKNGITREEAFDVYNVFLPKYNDDGTGMGSAIKPMNMDKNELYLTDLDTTPIMSVLKGQLSADDKIRTGDNTFEVMLSTFDNYLMKYFNTPIEYPQEMWLFPANCSLKEDRYQCKEIATGGEAKSGFIYLPRDYSVENNELSITGLALYSFPGERGFLTDRNGRQYCEDNGIRFVTQCLYDNQDKFTKITLNLDISDGKRTFKSIKKESK